MSGGRLAAQALAQAAAGAGGPPLSGVATALGSAALLGASASGANTTSSGASPAAYFKVVATEKELDIRAGLDIIVDSDQSPADKDTFKVSLEIWIIHKRAQDVKEYFYKIFSIDSQITKSEDGYELALGDGAIGDSAIPLAYEPGWKDGSPLFGVPAHLNILGDDQTTVTGGENIKFHLPTFRFGEMEEVAKDDGDDKETLLIQIGSKVDVEEKDTQITGRKFVYWDSMKEMLDSKLTSIKSADTENKHSGLSYLILPETYPLPTKTDRLSIKSKGKLLRRGQHLETIVIHSISALHLLKTNNSYDKSKSDQIEKIFDVKESAELLKSINRGAHYIIARDGAIVELARPRYKVLHAGLPTEDLKPGEKHNPNDFIRGNTRSVGIELIGFGDDFRTEVMNTYDAMKASSDDDERNWATDWENFIDGHGGKTKTDGATATNYADEDLLFYGYTESQYKALGSLIGVLGSRYGYIRVCTHSWVKSLDSKMKKGDKEWTIPKKRDPGSKFVWNSITASLVAGGFPSGDDNVYMVTGFDKGDARL